MQKSKIEWTDYTVNPVKGYCPVGCEYCYARRMYDRFKWDKTIRYDDASWIGLKNVIQPSRIFAGSTIELFGDWIMTAWMNCIFDQVKLNPQHTFIFLTKQPQNLQKWSPFPENCWVGVSADMTARFRAACYYLPLVRARVKFISFEPLSSEDIMPAVANLKMFNWLIIGAETGNRKEKPPLTEVHKRAKEIIEAADEAGIPVFLKDNLKWDTVRREWPK